MSIIKKTSYALTMMLVATLFTACSGGGSASPEEAAVNFLNALQNADFEKAKKYATDSSAELLDMAASMATLAEGEIEDAEPKSFTIDEVAEDGDKAVVSYTVDGEGSQKLNLKKEGGNWKVAFDKESMMGDMDMDLDLDDIDLDDIDMEDENIMDEDANADDMIDEGMEDSDMEMEETLDSGSKE